MPTRRTTPPRKKRSSVSREKTVNAAAAQPAVPTFSPAQTSLRATASPRKLWTFVIGTSLVIVIIWVSLIGVNLGRTTASSDSLWDQVRTEFSRVFGNNSQAANTNTGDLTESELRDLEERVFPGSAQDSGSFRTLPE